MASETTEQQADDSRWLHQLGRHVSDLSKIQAEWLKSVGWDKTNALESIALIASEIGEAANECRGDEPTENFGTELADIMLRTMGLAHRYNVDIGAEIVAKMELNKRRGTRGRKK